MSFCSSFTWKVCSLLASSGPKHRPQVWLYFVWLGPVSIPHCSGAPSLGQFLQTGWISLEPLNSRTLSEFLMTGKLLHRYRGSILHCFHCARIKPVGPNCSRNKFIGNSCKVMKIARASNRFLRSHGCTQKGYLEFFSIPQSNQANNRKPLMWTVVLNFFCSSWMWCCHWSPPNQELKNSLTYTHFIGSPYEQ